MATEKRLIDADALGELLDVEYRRKMELVRKGEDHLDTLAEGIMAMAVVIGTMPTVDAVEVVRCKDCKHYRRYGPGADGFESFGKCLLIDMDVDMPVNGYCCYGERCDSK